MPSYAPPKPAKPRRPKPKPLSFDWPIRRANAITVVQSLRAQFPAGAAHFDQALAELEALRYCKSNATYNRHFISIRKRVLLGLGLLAAKEPSS